MTVQDVMFLLACGYFARQLVEELQNWLRRATTPKPSRLARRSGPPDHL